MGKLSAKRTDEGGLSAASRLRAIAAHAPLIRPRFARPPSPSGEGFNEVHLCKKIRLIARLDVKDTNLVKGIQLEGLRKLGDPNSFAKAYYEQGIDELLYIDIVASLYNRNNLSDIVRKTVDDVYIPVCVGGGLRSVEDVRHILSMGADKVAINTAAIKRPELITEVANAFGSQCMVLSIQPSATAPARQVGSLL